MENSTLFDFFKPFPKGDVPVVETDWERYEAGLNTTWEGPGHGSVLEDSAGDWWLVYHSWRWRHEDMQSDPGRVMLLDRLELVLREGLCNSHLCLMD